MERRLLYGLQHDADFYTDHQLMVSAIFFHFLKVTPELASKWRAQAIFKSEQNWGLEPDAFICDQDKPILALAYAGPRTKVANIHEYCKQRDLPYELWGQRYVNAWYNPSCHRLFSLKIREEVIRQFGPCKCFPALKYLT
jgi:hypothetical protein